MTGISTIAPRLAQLVRMLASPVDGEALNATRAIGRTLVGAKLDFHDLATFIEDGGSPFVYRPTGPVYRPKAEPATTPPNPPKPRPAPKPWPTYGTLRHSQVVAWLHAIEGGPHSIDKTTRPIWDDLMRQIIVRPHEMLTRKQINLFNRLLRSTWEKSVRV